MKNILLLFSIIFFTVILKSDAYSTTSKTCYVSASGTLAECFFDNEVLNLSLLFSSGSSANYTLLKSAENPAEYSNSEIIFRDEGSEVFVKYSDRSEEKFCLQKSIRERSLIMKAKWYPAVTFFQML